MMICTSTEGEIMSVKIYRIEGKMLLKGEWKKFKMEVRALNERDALEEIFSKIGSRHKCKRKHILVKNIKEISLNEAENKYIRELSTLNEIYVW